MNTRLQQRLTAAVIRLLRPLVRVLIRHEMSHAEFAELARRAYVKEAYSHFGIAGRKMTYSRVAVLTGLSRKEVVRLAKLDDSEAPAASAPNRAARVIDGWLRDSEFQTDAGNPAVLPLQGETGSFAALVSRYSGDITLGAIADELVRVGVVARPSKESVELVSAGYIPHADELEKVHVLSVCSADLLDTAAHNLEAEPSDRRFQRQLSYADVPVSMVEEFRLEAEEGSAHLLNELQEFFRARNLLSRRPGC